MKKKLNLVTLAWLASIPFVMLTVAPAFAVSDSLQMLPPTLLNSSSQCQGSANNILFFSGVSGKDSNGIYSAINCSPNLKIDGNGNPTVTNSLTVGQGQNVVNINSNQVWNAGGNLYLNYSAPSSNVIVGGNNQYENLLVSKGEVQIPSSWDTLDFVHINGNQVYNTGGNLYLNANGPDSASVVVGGGPNAQNLSIPKLSQRRAGLFAFEVDLQCRRERAGRQQAGPHRGKPGGCAGQCKSDGKRRGDPGRQPQQSDPAAVHQPRLQSDRDPRDHQANRCAGARTANRSRAQSQPSRRQQLRAVSSRAHWHIGNRAAGTQHRAVAEYPGRTPAESAIESRPAPRIVTGWPRRLPCPSKRDMRGA